TADWESQTFKLRPDNLQVVALSSSKLAALDKFYSKDKTKNRKGTKTPGSARRNYPNHKLRIVQTHRPFRTNRTKRQHHLICFLHDRRKFFEFFGGEVA